MRLEFSKQSDAQAKADAIHLWMIGNNPAYAASVKAGHTLRWAVPYQPTDENGRVLSSEWCVNVKDRCLVALTGSERNALK